MHDAAMQPLKLGIIGFGRIGEKHFERFSELEGLFEFTAVCDQSPARRQHASSLGVNFVTDSLEAFCQQPLDVALISTHSSAHVEPAEACLRAGFHIIVEKPVTIRGPEAEKLFVLAQECGRTMLVHHNRRFDPDYQEVRRLVQDRGVGEVIYVENRVGAPRPAVGFGVKEFNQAWRITKEMGGGTLLDFGPHYVDQVLDLIPSKVVQVLADVRPIKWGDADDYFNLHLTFESGARAVISKADFVHYCHPKWLVYGKEATVWRDKEGATHWRNEEETVTTNPYKSGPSLHRNYFEVFRENAEPLIKPQQALRVAQVLEAAMQSAEQQRQLEVQI